MQSDKEEHLLMEIIRDHDVLNKHNIKISNESLNIKHKSARDELKVSFEKLLFL